MDFNSNQGHNLTDPTSAQDAASKNYVDTKALTVGNPITGGTANRCLTEDGSHNFAAAGGGCAAGQQYVCGVGCSTAPPTFSGLSANQVTYATSGSAITSSANLTFDGTNLGVNSNEIVNVADPTSSGR